MPSYSSPELKKSHKKPRPKSLAISTPTRLLSLEEARERAFLGGLDPSRRYIDVGGGPDSLPSKYHTVLDVHGYKKKSNTVKETSSKGNKKSPVSGWKSFFSKPRSGSIKKARKSSIQGSNKELDTVSLGGAPLKAKALTEEDVHNWKKRLRTAKSAESLLSLASSSRSSSSRCSKPNDNLMVVNVYGEDKVHSSHHKRSLSSDATAILHHHSYDNPFSDRGREVPIDVDLSVEPHSKGIDPRQTGRRSRSEKRTEPERQQSFVRGDSKRKALHRRTPSAPNTPRNERSSSETRQVSSRHKTSSQPTLESPSLEMGRQDSSQESCDEDEMSDRWLGNLSADSPQTVKKKAYQNGDGKPPRSADEVSPQKRCAKMPPIGRKKQKANTEKNLNFGSGEDILTVQLPESPGARRKGHGDSKENDGAKQEPIITQYFYSRTHDYAEILSDEESQNNGSPKVRETMIMGSPSSMSELITQLDDKLTSTGMQYGIYETIPSPPEKTVQKASPENSGKVIEEKHIPPVEVKTEHLPSRPVEFCEIGPHDVKEIRSPDSQKSINSEIQHLEKSLQQMQHSQPQSQMSKCLSVPSDIAKSLENVNVGSQSDLLSSVTISELSQSVDSFNLSLCDDSPMGEARRRRSASLDSLTDSPLGRTLKEINMQIDNAFKRNVDRAIELEEEGYQRHESPVDDLPPLHISEDVLTPTNQPETNFPEIPDYARIDKTKTVKYKSEHPEKDVVPKMRFSPVDQIEIVSGNVKIAPPSTQEAYYERIVGNASRAVNGQMCSGSFGETNNNKQTFVERPADLQIVAAPSVLRAPAKSKSDSGSSSESSSQRADICAQGESSSSSSSSESESSSSSDSEENSDVSIEYVSHKNSQPSQCTPGFPHCYSESHISEKASLKSSSRHSNTSLPGYCSSSGKESDATEQDSVTWRDSPIFSDSGSVTPTGKSQNFRGSPVTSQSIGRASPASSQGMGRSSPWNSYAPGSGSSVESSPRLSPRSSPRVPRSPDYRGGSQDVRFVPGGDRLVLPGDFYCTGGHQTSPSISPHHQYKDINTQPLSHQQMHPTQSHYPGVNHMASAQSSHFHSSPSLPEVHVVHDTVTLEKPTIKRSTTESKLLEKSYEGLLPDDAYSSRTFPRNDPDRRFHQRMQDRDHMRERNGESMEVDSVVCNMSESVRSVPEEVSGCSYSYSIKSTSVSSGAETSRVKTCPSPDTSVIFTLNPQSSSTEVMEVETSVTLSANSVSPTYVEKRFEKSSVETNFVRVESYGELQPEDFENVVNSRREMMMTKDSNVIKSPVPAKRERKNAPVPKKRQQKSHVPTDCSDMPPLCGGTTAAAHHGMQDLAPPNHEVVEIKRSTVKRTDRSTPPRTFGQDNISRTVIVKEITSEKGDAKLVIERRADLPKSIQTVRAKKVPHPSRQLAEALDDMSDSVTPDLSSTGPSDAEPSGISSQEDDVFSDIDSGRRRLQLHPRFTPDHDVLMIEEDESVPYSHTKAPRPKPSPRHFDDMVGSRSSLDESVLQLAAERHDTFGPEDDRFGESETYSTGSLRVKRSQKMQSLVDLFEKGSDQNLADSSSPTSFNEECTPSPQLSMSLPSSALRHIDRDVDTDDEASAPSPRLIHSSMSRRSRSRERMRRSGLGSDKENRLTSRSPTPNRQKAAHDRTVEDRHPPTSPAEVAKEYRTKRKEKYSSFSKPPRYRSGSRGRTQSESSTSESEGSHYLDGSFHSRSSDPNASSGSDSVLRDKNRSHDRSNLGQRSSGADSQQDKSGSGLQRRGSIKELMDYFERQQSTKEEEEVKLVPPSPPVKPRTTRTRVRSVSPSRGAVPRPQPEISTPPNYRFSLEIPTSAAISINEGGVKSQPLRLGPKPFYGVKK